MNNELRIPTQIFVNMRRLYPYAKRHKRYFMLYNECESKILMQRLVESSLCSDIQCNICMCI